MALREKKIDIKKEIFSIDYIVDNSMSIYFYDYKENNIVNPTKYNKNSEEDLYAFDLLVFIPSYESYLAIIRSNSSMSFRSIENHSKLAEGSIVCKNEYFDYISMYINDDDLSSFIIDDLNNPILSMDNMYNAKNIDIAIVSPQSKKTIHRWPVSPLPIVGFYPFLIKKNNIYPNDTIETYLGEEIVYINKKIIN